MTSILTLGTAAHQWRFLVALIIVVGEIFASNAVQHRAPASGRLAESDDDGISGSAVRDDDGTVETLMEMDTASDMCRAFESMPSTCPWGKPSEVGKTTEICVEGKALPKLYVLGAQKTSTSSLAKDLECAGITLLGDGKGNKKEMHFFDARTVWHGHDVEHEQWLTHMPDCSAENNVSTVTGDFTPDNLRMVKGEHPYVGEFLSLPSTLFKFYGGNRGDRGYSTKITFVVMLREPLSRMASAWYASKMCRNFAAICTDDCKANNIQDAMTRALGNANSEPAVYTEWLWTSMYARHLRSWFDYFEPHQFYLIPYLQYASGDADNICHDLGKRLGFGMDCQSNGTSVTHDWASRHPSVDEDFPPDSNLRQQFKALMDKENDLLWEVLATGHELGMGMANYHGRVGNEEDIAEYVQSSW